MKTLLVGELNPYGADPAYALYPHPRHASGNRLREIMELEDNAYLRAFDRVNLCTGRWLLKKAREAAQRIVLEAQPKTIVLLGKKVCDAFNCPFQPFTLSASGRGYPRVVLPHPSGINRMWNEPGAYARARKILREAGVLPVDATPDPVACANCGVATVSGSQYDCQDCGRP